MNLFFYPTVSMEDTYRSLEKPAEGIYRDRNSRFLAFGFPVISEDKVDDLLTGIRKRYHDARHHCFAYRLGFNKEYFRMNDDGEPSGTAGKPIYGQLVSHDLTNTLAVVVRYFGGTLLGTSGLINAYRSATSDMLSRANIITHYVEERYDIRFPHEKLNQVMKILKEGHIVPLQPDFDQQCAMQIAVRKSLSKKLLGVLQTIKGVAVEAIKLHD
jgi:uncharacterized YigZ family protein